MLNLSIFLFASHSLLITYLIHQNNKLHYNLKKLYKKINYTINGNSYYHIDYKIPYANIVNTFDKSYQKDLETGYLLEDSEYVTM